jgi:hypothetical protein
MPVQNSNTETSQSRRIEYLSPAAEVSMTDGYFQIATTNHFWVSRRFDVLQCLADGVVSEAAKILRRPFLASTGTGFRLMSKAN